MKMLKNLMIAALLLNLAACAKIPVTTGGVGYKNLTPSSDTVKYIVGNDRQFANQVASHNRFCKQDKDCKK